MKPRLFFSIAFLLAFPLVAGAADDKPRSIPVHLAATEVLATGNEWLALPAIRVSDGAITDFNVLSMRDRGLLEVNGANGVPAIEPKFSIDGKPVAFTNPSWERLEYWIPRARLITDQAEIDITHCAPPGSRAAFVEIVLTNRGSKNIDAWVGMHASWGSLSRVAKRPSNSSARARSAPRHGKNPPRSFSGNEKKDS
jgi:hypothetical protein